MKKPIAKAAGLQNKTSYGLWQQIKRSKVSYFLMAPYALFFIVFLVLPVLASVYYSLTYFNMLQPPRFVGLQNFERMFLEDKVFIKVVKNTILFAIFTGPLGYILSFVFAWIINEFGRKLRSVLTFLFYVPSLSTNLFFMWQYMFSGDSYGIVNGTLISMGIINEPILWMSDAKTMIPVLIIVQLWASIGTAFLAFIAGFQSQDQSLFEAGAIDGIKNRWQELWYISVPQMAPQLLFGAVMQIQITFSIGSIIQALAGWPTTEYAADTIVTYMMDVANIRFEMGYGCAIAVFLFALMLLTSRAISNALRKYSMD